MEIKVGSRWVATGRNMDRFEGEVTNVLTERRPNGLSLVYVKDEKGHFYTYNRDFFLSNFTPIEGQTVRNFKVGDLVEVKYQGVISEIDRTDQTCNVDRPFRGMELTEIGLQFSEITLIKPVPPELEVGQTWQDIVGTARTLRIIENDRVCYWDNDDEFFNDCSIECFKEQFAHKLITGEEE